MATVKTKTVWFCKACGNESPKWMGRCPACGEWNTMVEETVATGKKTASQQINVPGTGHKPMPLADIDSAVDTEKLIHCGVQSIQINTCGACHLDADMTKQGLKELDTANLDLVFLENIGNLVCPAAFDTGAVKNMTILSVPEGDDKPLKYPRMYETCQLLVVNKVDVLEYFDFDKEKVIEYAKMRNPEIEIIFISAKTGEGIKELADWIRKSVDEWNSQ